MLLFEIDCTLDLDNFKFVNNNNLYYEKKSIYETIFPLMDQVKQS